MENAVDYLCAMSFDRGRFREVRKRYGGREKLAAAIGTSATTIQNWETTDIMPSFELLLKAAKEMAVSVAYLVGETDEPGAVIPPQRSAELDKEPFYANANYERAELLGMSEDDIKAALELLHTKAKILIYEHELRERSKKK